MNEAEQANVKELLDLAVLEGDVTLLETFFAENPKTDVVLKLAEDSMVGAIVDGNYEIVEYLLSVGVSANARDKDDDLCALHYCAEWCRVEIAELLMASGADVNCTDRSDNNVPIIRAMMNNIDCPQMTEVLLKHHPDMALKNSHGVTPASLAESLGIDVES